MGIADTYSRGRVLVENPAPALLAAGFGVVLLDLLRRLLFGGLAVSRLATLAWDGLVIGAVIGLAGIGLSMTYSILNFANFSHGDYVTTGGFAGWSVTYLVAGLGRFDVVNLILVSGVSTKKLGIAVSGALSGGALRAYAAILAGIVVAAVATLALALLIDRVVYRPMRDEGGISLLIASIGVALALRYTIVFFYDQSTRGLTAGGRVADLSVGGVNVSAHEATTLVVAVVLMLAVHYVLQRTKLGKAMRAMADNEDLARVTGIPTERVVTWTWVIGGGLAGVAGYLISLESGTLSYNFGWLLLLLIFSAVILGGIGSIYGAIVGGLIIGLTNSVSLVWLPGGLTKVAAFLMLIVVLLFKPSGIFGGRATA